MVNPLSPGNFFQLRNIPVWWAVVVFFFLVDLGVQEQG